MSAKRAAELTHNMYSLHYLLPGDPLPKETLLGLDDEQKLLFNLLHT
jgi:hypothetical protein